VPKNEDGEFELILGNRQLLSVFFIVIVLFALFFVMGYILGRNSGPLAPETAVARKTEKPLVVESPGRDTGRDTNPAPPARKSEPETPASQEKPQAPPEKVKPEEPAKFTKAPEPKPEPVRTPPPAPTPASNEPAAGTYLQLAATSEHEATLEVDLLRKKGFKAQVSEVPEKPGVFRVLVGPLSDVNKTKADLQGSGFPGDRAIKRTY
jgi:outer membrane biosynthesis protein TonB